MSQPKGTWHKEIRCPYCDGTKQELHDACCHEVHCREVWVDEDGNEMEEV